MNTQSSFIGAALLLATSLVTATDAGAQTAPLQSFTVPYSYDTGPVTAFGQGLDAGAGREVVASFTVSVPGTNWLRLYFESVDLAGNPKDGDGAILRIVSHLDGDFQELDAITIDQWRLSSAYLNGDTVQVEVLARPGTKASRVVLRDVDAGAPLIESQCGATDDRLPSMDARAARILPVGCTAWMIDDCNHCFLTAGHCSTSANSVQVVQFNVPLSSANGSLNNPPAADQYPVDASSLQSNGGGGVGNDWGYFGTFPNSNTGLAASVAQGSWYTVAAPVSGTPGNIRITGYGVDSSPGTWNQIQQTHDGPWVVNTGTTLGYQTDTRGGNSGSPVIHETTGNAIGIHTHGGCQTNGTGNNSGTSLSHPALQQALANPQGVCSCGPGGMDDVYEENDTCGQAAPLGVGTFTGLLAVGPDQDYFSVNVPAGATVTIDCLFAHASGDLDMELWDNGCATQLDVSNSTTNNEQVAWTNGGASAATVKAQVYYYQGAGTNGYDLTIQVSGGSGCTGNDDALEQNDDCGAAFPVQNGTYSGLIVSKTDWDYYAINVAPGDTLTVDLVFTHGVGDIDMFLYTSNGCSPFAAGDVGCAGSLECGFSGTSNETLSHTNTTGAMESLVLKVNIYPPTTTGDCNTYDMSIGGAAAGGIGSNFCTANANSTGVAASISATGSTVVANNDLTLLAADMPLNTFGFFVSSRTQVFVPNVGGGAGNLCIGPALGRGVGGVIFSTGPSGTASVPVDLNVMPQPMSNVAVVPGDTWNFQGWTRDTVLGVPTSNLTNGLQIVFQ